MGLSQLSRPLQTPENYAAWVAELLDGLGISQAAVIGHSYGGWLAANFAMRHPERVTRLTLISPAATFAPLSWQFYIRGILGGTTGWSWVIYSMVDWMTTLKEPRGLEIVEQFRLGLQTMAQLPAGFPTVFSNEALQALSMPVQFIIGDHEVIYARPPAKVVQLAKEKIPHIQIAWIPDGGHAVTLDQAAATNVQLARFHRN
jgi:pimeloyl-ACP methyl ester carboxylesterase